MGVFSAMFVYGAAAGSAGASPSAPTTDITHQPSDVSRQPTATFTFSSSLRHSTFACQIDGSAWQSCTSPVTYKALANGSHQFSVKAISKAGVTDPNPPMSSWVVAHALPRLVFPVDRGAGTAAATVFSPSAGTMIPVKVVEPRGSWNTGVYTITYLGQSLCTIDTGTPHRITTCGKVPSCVRRLAVCSAPYSSHLRMTDSRNAAIEDLPVTIALTQLSTSRKATPNHANWLGFSYRFPVRAQTTATVISAKTGTVVYQGPVASAPAALHLFRGCFRWSDRMANTADAPHGWYTVSVRVKTAAQTKTISKRINLS